MSDKKKIFPNRPPGFSDDDFRPINIDSVKKTKKGFELEIKPNREKEEGAEYQYKLDNGVYHILRNGKAVYTPSETEVTVTNEALAKRTVEHMNIYGEEYESPYSIVCFVYSWIDFFEQKTKTELESPICNDYETDWLFEARTSNEEESSIWPPEFRDINFHYKPFNAWLKTLTKFQTGIVIIIGASLKSVTTAYLLSKVWEHDDLKKLAQEYFDLRDQVASESEIGLHIFWRPDEVAKIFENYLFCQGLEI